MAVVSVAIVLVGSVLAGCGSAVAPGAPTVGVVTAGTTPAVDGATPLDGSETADGSTPPWSEPRLESAPPSTGSDRGAPTTTLPSDMPLAVAYPFDGPPLIDGTWMIGWGDSMRFDDEFVMTAPDDGSGHWQYRQVSSGCLVDFWQVKDSSALGTGGDRAMSDLLLAQVAGVDAEAVSGAAGDDMLSNLVPGSDDTIQTRSINARDRTTGEALLYEARYFADALTGVAIGLRCPKGTDLSDSTKVPLLRKVALMIVGS